MRKFLSYLFLIVMLCLSYMQSDGQCVFHKLYRYSSTLNDYGHSVIQTSDGGYVISGVASFVPSEHKGLYVVKTDECGDTLWQVAYDLSSNGVDHGKSILQLQDDSYSICGYVFDSVEGAGDTYFAKLNVNGDTILFTTIEGGYSDVGIMHKLTSDNGYIIGGYNHDSTNTSSQVFLIKTDSFGNKQWQQEYGDIGYDYINSLDITPDGGYIISGEFENPETSTWDLFLLKTDSLGNERWKEHYDQGYYDAYGCAVSTADSGFVIIGSAEQSDGTYDGYIAKTDSLGAIIWDNTFGIPSYNDYFKFVRQLADESFVVAGGIADQSANPNGRRVWLLKIDTQGDTIWTKSYNYYEGSKHTYVEDLNLTNDGGFIMTGYIINNALPAKNDLWLLKTDSLGNTCTIDTVTWEGCSDLVTVVEMGSYGEAGSVLVYPNPAPGQITVICEPKGRAEFILYDLTGVEVLRKAIQGNMHVELNGLSGGIYLYRVVMVGERISTGKLVIIR